jgi:hypothetical protein
MARNLAECCDALEECYEFMLAYAAQGLAGDAGSSSGDQLRTLLRTALDSIANISETYKSTVVELGLQPAEKHMAFAAVLDQDARAAAAAMDLVLSQPAISSQLVDNLNASIHLRALLTDFFVIDEIIKLRQTATAAK